MASYLPSVPQVARETLAVLAATVIAAWIISKWPAAQQLVRGNTVPGPLNPYNL